MEEQQARVGDALSGVTVGHVMTPDPVRAPEDLTVEQFVDHYVFRNRHSTFPLVDPLGRPSGLITLRRVKDVPPAQRGATRIRELACGIDDVAVAAPDEALEGLLPRMSACPDGRALVVDGGRLVGIVSPADVVRQLEISELRGGRTHHR